MINFKVNAVHTKPLNVGLVSKICRVSKKTILNWIYKGYLPFFQTPGQHYRIWPADLAEFITKSNMDIPFRWQETRKLVVLCIGVDTDEVQIIKGAALAYNTNHVVLETTDVCEACYILGEQKPKLIFITEPHCLTHRRAIGFYSGKCLVFLLVKDPDSVQFNFSITHGLFSGYVKAEQADIIRAINKLTDKFIN